MRDMDWVAKAVWGPEVGAQMAATQQAHDDTRALIRELRSGTASRERQLDRVADQMVSTIEREAQRTRHVLALGFSALLMESEAQTRELDRIAHALENPRSTGANEFLTRGRSAFATGLTTGNATWFADARRDFAACLDLDPYRYDAHWFLGHIAFEHEQSPLDALTHFAEAARLAEVANGRAASASLAWVSLLELARGRNREALRAALGAARLTPDWGVARHTVAAAHARNGSAADAAVEAKLAISLDPREFYVVAEDPALAAIPEVAAHLESTFRSAVSAAEAAKQALARTLADANEVRQEVGRLSEVGRWDAIRVADEALLGLSAGLNRSRYDLIVPATAAAREARATLIASVAATLAGLEGSEPPSSRLWTPAFLRHGHERRRGLYWIVATVLVGLAVLVVVVSIAALVAWVPAWLVVLILFAIFGADEPASKAVDWATGIVTVAGLAVVGIYAWLTLSQTILPAHRHRRMQALRWRWQDRYAESIPLTRRPS